MRLYRVTVTLFVQSESEDKAVRYVDNGLDRGIPECHENDDGAIMGWNKPAIKNSGREEANE